MPLKLNPTLLCFDISRGAGAESVPRQVHIAKMPPPNTDSLRRTNFPSCERGREKKNKNHDILGRIQHRPKGSHVSCSLDGMRRQNIMAKTKKNLAFSRAFSLFHPSPSLSLHILSFRSISAWSVFCDRPFSHSILYCRLFLLNLLNLPFILLQSTTRSGIAESTFLPNRLSLILLYGV